MRHARRLLPWFAALVVMSLAITLAPTMVERLAYAAEKGSAEAAREELKQLSQREQLSRLFRTVAKAVRPAVVEVRVKKRVSVTDQQQRLEDFLRRFWGDDEFFRGLPQRPRPDDDQRRAPRERYRLQRGLGSGVIVDGKNGYVLTNHHVVTGADEVEIVLEDGTKHQTEWVRGDWKTDLAVVKVKAKGLVDAPLGDSDKMEVGDWVLAVGAPRGLSQTVTAGIISAKGRKTGGRPYESYLQTDAAINLGNSGGPLVNMRGEVVGINNAIVSASGGNEGIGLAVPSNMAKKILAQLVDKGEVVRGWLGVMIQNVSEDLAEALELPDTKGALVTKVLSGSPAEKAGLRERDLIVAIGGKPVEDMDELRNRVADLEPGKKVKFSLYREGKKETVPVTIGTQPDDLYGRYEVPGVPEKPAKFGLEVQTLTKELARRHDYDEDTKGVLITEVEPDSDAAEKGLRAGMVIDEVNGQKVASNTEFARAAAKTAKKDRLQLRVMTPDGGARYLVLRAK